MNTAKPNIIVGPALFGRYLLSPESENNQIAKAALPEGNQFTNSLLDFAYETDTSGSKFDRAELQLSEAISGRDFLVLLALLHVSKTLSVANLDGGFSFLASDLKTVLDLSNSGANTLAIEGSITRLSKINVSAVISDSKCSDGRKFTVDFGSIISEFSNGRIEIQEDIDSEIECRSRARVWFMRFGLGFNKVLSNTETTKYDWEELTSHRKSSLIVAGCAHVQTIYGKKHPKKVSTFFRNINTPIITATWGKCRHYRSKLSNQLKRLSKNISRLTPPDTGTSLFHLPRLLVSL